MMPNSASVTLRVPTSLSELTGARDRIGFDVSTVDELLERVRNDEPLLAGHLFADDGRIRGYVNLFVNGVDVRLLEAGERDLPPGSVVTIVPSVAGG
jgi:molybdopterin converting factor small subunit